MAWDGTREGTIRGWEFFQVLQTYSKASAPDHWMMKSRCRLQDMDRLCIS
jgi:hypothetical protein